MNGNNKVFDVLNKFDDKMKNNILNLDEIFTGKENKWSSKLNKLKDDLKKLGNYIEKNNDKKLTRKKN